MQNTKQNQVSLALKHEPKINKYTDLVKSTHLPITNVNGHHLTHRTIVTDSNVAFLFIISGSLWHILNIKSYFQGDILEEEVVTIW